MKSTSIFVLGFLLTLPAHATDTIENFLGMRFVEIPAGEFIMGTEDPVSAIMEIPEPEANALAEETPAHTVVISKPFFIGQTEVTQQQWLTVMENKPGPEAVWRRDDWQALPVASVNWYMAQRFVEELGKMDSQYRYRLPTEAEWEYVARDGSSDLRPVDPSELEEHAWYIMNSGDVPQPVATREPNGFGVHDMMGNVWEWVADWYAPDTYTKEKRADPTGPAEGRSRVRRGGSYHCPLHLIRPGYRSANAPGTRFDVLGFRVIAEPR